MSHRNWWEQCNVFFPASRTSVYTIKWFNVVAYFTTQMGVCVCIWDGGDFVAQILRHLAVSFVLSVSVENSTVFHFSANKQNHVIGPRKFVWLKNSYICILSMVLWARSIGKCNINVVLFWTHQSNNKNDIFVRKNGSSVCNALYFLFENTLHHLCGEWALSPSLLSIFLFSEWERTRATKLI